MAPRQEEHPELRIRLRTARKEDLYDLARVYLRAFPDSPRELSSPQLSPLAVADVMRAPLLADPHSILLACLPEGEVVGYVVAVTDATTVFYAAILRWLLVTWLARWVRGLYRLSLRGAWILFSDSLQVSRARRKGGTDTLARIISVAVHPQWQRHGFGQRLMEAALQRLRELGCPRVALEVRPHNITARRLYARLGFAATRGFPDTRGQWVEMQADTREANG